MADVQNKKIGGLRQAGSTKPATLVSSSAILFLNIYRYCLFDTNNSFDNIKQGVFVIIAASGDTCVARYKPRSVWKLLKTSVKLQSSVAKEERGGEVWAVVSN
jgi:hypothetical protein